MNTGLTMIASVMTRDVCQVGKGQAAMESLALMRSRSVSSVLVVENDLILGIITERDIVRSLDAKCDLKALSCADLMQTPVITGSAQTTCLDAYHLMVGRDIRHLAVTDEAGHVLGIVSEGDVMRNFGIEYYSRLKDVGSVMSTEFCKLPPAALVAEALRQMVEHHQSCVLVVDDQGHAIGVLTERDIVTLTSDQVPTEQLTLYEAMRAPVITIRPRKPLHAAVKSMEDAHVRRLVVTDDKDVACGLLTHHEVARGLEGDYVAYLKEMVEMQASAPAQGAQGVDEKLLLANILRGMSGAAALASDRDYRISYASPNVETVLGLRVEDIAGADLRDTLKAIGWSAAAASLTEPALASGGRHHSVAVAGGKIDFQVSLLLDDQKNAKGYLVLARKA
jgi:CBS domain-containing protein